MVIDTTGQIAEMPIIALTGVDCLLGKDLRSVFDHIFHNKCSCLRVVSICRLKPLLCKVS